MCRMAFRRAAFALLALALAACARDAGRDLATYYDDQGLFIVGLPADNDITVTQPQAAQGGPSLLTGVISSPPAPSPSPQAGIGSTLAAPQQPDQTVYQAFAVTSDSFADLDAMALYFLTADPVVDVVSEDPIRIDGEAGRLVVADVRSDGQVSASLAVAMTLGDGKTGYLLAAIFPPGAWGDERPDFDRVLHSFRTEVPPGLRTFPVSAGTA